MVKIAKNATLLSLSLLFVFVFVLIPIAQAKQNQSREISFKPVKASQNNLDFASKKDFSEQADNTASLIISHGSVSYGTFSDNNGNGYYRKTTYWFDVDSNKVVNYYAVFYIDDYDGYGWYTTENLKSDVYTINGYSPDDGIYLTSIYWMGSKEAEEAVKIEVYFEDGTLADTYGPDDNPDLSHIKIESIDFDVKRNPFINPTPAPTPTPTTDDAKITGYVVNNGGDSIIGAKVVARKEGEVVANTSSDENGEFTIEGLNPGEYDLRVSKKGYRSKTATVTIKEDYGNEKIIIQLRKR